MIRSNSLNSVSKIDFELASISKNRSPNFRVFFLLMICAFVMSIPELCIALRPQRCTNHAIIVFFLHAFFMPSSVCTVKAIVVMHFMVRGVYVNYPLTLYALSGMMRLAWNGPLFISRGHRL